MDVETPFVADGEPAEAAHPGEGAFNHPPMSAEFLAAVDPTAGDAGLDPAPVARAAAAAVVIGLVGVQLAGALAGTPTLASDAWDSVEQGFERHAVVDIGAGQQEGERNPATVGEEVTLAAGAPSVRRVGAGRRTPLLAAMEALSMQARLQSIRPASRNRRSNSRCRRSHTPATCQSRSRRQQVTPEPQFISRGSISHGMPVRRTNRMPVRAARAGTGGASPLRLAPFGRQQRREDGPEFVGHQRGGHLSS